MLAKLLIFPSLETRKQKIVKILIDNNLSNPHPDLLYLPYDSKLGISEARKIKEHFSLKPYSAKGRAIVLEDASTLTIEAQNALLKTLEELPEDGLFILGADSDSKLLPTIVSRCEIVILDSFQNLAEGKMLNPFGFTQDRQVQHDIEELLKSSTKRRFEYIEKLKDKEEFLHEMVSFFHQKLKEPDTHERSGLANLKEFLQELLQAEEWVEQNVNIRAILEYLMLRLPSAE